MDPKIGGRDMTYEQKFQEILKFQGMYKNGFSALYLVEEQIDILIEYVWELREQAERVQELENKNKNLDFNLTTILRSNHEHRLRTARFRETLEFYADIRNYLPQSVLNARSNVGSDCGERARYELEKSNG